MKFLKSLLRFLIWRTNGGHLSTVVIYDWEGGTRYFTTRRMDALTRKSFLKRMFNTYNPKLIEVDGEPFVKLGNRVTPLKGEI